MKLSGLVDTLITDPVVSEAVRDARSDGVTTLDLSAPGPVRPVLLAAIASEQQGAGRPVLAVTATFREAEELTEALQCLVEPGTVAYYPAWETLPHERLSPRSDTVGRRLAVLRRLAHPDPSDETTGPIKILVAPVRSVLQPQVAGLADLKPVQLHIGDTVELEEVVEALAGAAYHRVDLVERRGEFAVRGGIIDVFPPTEEHPLRVDFFGDDVEEIRSFSVADQRTLEKQERLWAPPCRELLLTDEVRVRARELGSRHPELREITDKLAEGVAVEGMESLAPVLVDDMELLVDLLPADSLSSISASSGWRVARSAARARTASVSSSSRQAGAHSRSTSAMVRWSATAKVRTSSTSSPQNSTRTGCSSVGGKTSRMPPRTANSPRLVTRSTRL